MKRFLILLVVSFFTISTAALADSKPSVYKPVPTITFGGGQFQSDPKVVLVFWGPSWTSSDAEVQAEQIMFQQMGSSSYMQLLGQYAIHSVTYAGTYIDNSAAVDPNTCSGVACPLGLQDFYAEIDHVRNIIGADISGQAQYLIFPDANTNLSGYSSECAEHDSYYQTPQNIVIPFGIIMPFTNSLFSANCPADYSADNGTREINLIQADTSIASHEFGEIATDPQGTGWHNGNTEIADLCAWYSGIPQGMTENVSYLWSVTDQACENPIVPTPVASTPQNTPSTITGGYRHHHKKHHRHHHRRTHCTHSIKVCPAKKA